MLEPLYRGENALEPERVSEKLHQNTFWMGRGGTITHAISGIDIALWDILGKATGQPVGRLLGGRYRERVRPYASLLMDEPEPLARAPRCDRSAGISRVQDRLGAVRPRQMPRLDEAIVQAAREAVGDDCLLMVDAGGSDAFWPNGLQMGAPHRRDARRVRRRIGSRRRSTRRARRLRRSCARSARADRRRRGADPAAGVPALARRRGAFDIVQPDVTKVGGISEERRIAWMAQEHGVRFIPHGWNTAVGLAADLQLASAFPTPIWSNTSPARPTSTTSRRRLDSSTPTACSRFPPRPASVSTSIWKKSPTIPMVRSSSTECYHRTLSRWHDGRRWRQ